MQIQSTIDSGFHSLDICCGSIVEEFDRVRSSGTIEDGAGVEVPEREERIDLGISET
jgi:hypothetical protein